MPGDPARAPTFVEALIETTPGVGGGAAHVTRTRIPVWTLEAFRRSGWSDTRILESYPTLRAVDLMAAFQYAATHRDEIDRQIAENEAA